MSKRYIFSCICTVLIFLWTKQVTSYSDGPPPSRTGGPGEQSCSSVYCHGPAAPNTGIGNVSLSSNIPQEGYIPEEIYTITAKVASENMKRFGFQLSPVDLLSGESKGEFIDLDSSMQLIEEEGRIYLMHALAKVEDDSAAWTFNWKAPTAEIDSLGMFAAFVAANFDEKRSGDLVFTESIHLKKNPSTSIAPKLINVNYLSIYPSPVIQKLFIEMQLEQPSSLSISIWSMDGKIMYENVDYVKPGNYEQQIPTAHWAMGMYLVKIRSNGSRAVHKIMKI